MIHTALIELKTEGSSRTHQEPCKSRPASDEQQSIQMLIRHAPKRCRRLRAMSAETSDCGDARAKAVTVPSSVVVTRSLPGGTKP